jgi:hypothetical protein
VNVRERAPPSSTPSMFPFVWLGHVVKSKEAIGLALPPSEHSERQVKACATSLTISAHQFTSMAVFQNSMLKVYNLHYMFYRFSALTMEQSLHLRGLIYYK